MKYYIDFFKTYFHCLRKFLCTKDDHRILIEKYYNNEGKLIFKKVCCLCEVKK